MTRVALVVSGPIRLARSYPSAEILVAALAASKIRILFQLLDAETFKKAFVPQPSSESHFQFQEVDPVLMGCHIAPLPHRDVTPLHNR